MARFELEENRRVLLFEDKILVKVVKQELKNGNIIVPDAGEGKDNVLAEVMQLPREHKDWEIPVKVGDQVIISKFGGIEITINGVDFKVLRVSDTVVTFRKK